MALVWKLPELETERRNKILTLVHKLDPGTAAGLSTLHLQKCLPQSGPWALFQQQGVQRNRLRG